MAEEQLGQERSEQPTSKRLDESRKKGQVARSRELNMLFVMIASILFLWGLGGWMIEAGGELVTYALSPSGELLTNPRLLPSHPCERHHVRRQSLNTFFSSDSCCSTCGPRRYGRAFI